MAREKGLYKIIRDQIIEDYGSWLDGEALPGERELAVKYGVKRSTIKYALMKMEEQGKVYRIRGKGTFIHKHKESTMDINGAAVQGNKGISALVRSYGIKISNVVLACGVITGNRFLESKLDLQEGEPVYALHRVRYGNDEPLAIEYTYVPKKMFPDIEELDFSMVSLYDYMDANGYMPVKFDQMLRVARLSPKEARYLERPVDDPAFYFELIGVDSARRRVEYTESYIRCDKTEFKFTSRI